ncbi:MAG: sensor histidine kinase [Pseudomonadota bacterium]
MTNAVSLRLRLTAIILLPIMTVAGLAGLWQLDNARKTATDVFDRSLRSAAHAVANEVAISGGDALSPETRDILAGTSGGEVFYHVYAPDGVIVAGYATPPVGIPRPTTEAAVPTYFEATYLGRQVSGVRLQTRTDIDGFTGIFTTTVWQDRAVRLAFVRDLVLRSFIVIAGLIAALALIVWFGIRYGLRPLTDLEGAIEARSSDELSPIRRSVPVEVEGIVSTLNRLFAQVSKSMTAQSQFIANAAHQLRNPIAGVLSLAEAVAHAPNEAAMRERSADLLKAARQTAELGHQLLLLERAEAISPQSEQAPFDLSKTLPEWVEDWNREAPSEPPVHLDIHGTLPDLTGDQTMLREALANLIRNARRHGGRDLTTINVDARSTPDEIVLSVIDDGKGIRDADLPRALERFERLAETSSSGLGLSIVQAVVALHEGQFVLEPGTRGLVARMTLPLKSAHIQGA